MIKKTQEATPSAIPPSQPIVVEQDDPVLLQKMVAATELARAMTTLARALETTGSANVTIDSCNFTGGSGGPIIAIR
jgi:hypothetical protein